jgi:hypothetical protein
MIRNLKVLGLVLVAVFAMSAVAASAAFAAVEFHSEVATTTLKGEQVGTNVFHAGAGHDVECTTAKYEGTTTAATVPKVEVRPTFSGCRAFGFATTDVNTNSCTLFIEAEAQKGYYENSTHTGVCSAIVLTPTFLGSSVCTVNIKPGTTKYALDLTNEVTIDEPEPKKFVETPTTRDIKVTSTATGVPYEEVSGGGCGVGSGTNGELTGSVTTKGFNSLGAQVGIWKL